MEKGTKIYLILGVTVIMIIAGIFLLRGKDGGTSEDIAKCIGENSELYIQTGCHFCKIQEDLFGENYNSLNIIDCLNISQTQRCVEAQILATPTWIIDGKKYEGIQTIEKLKELTGC